MSENITEDKLREAELRRLNAQADRENAERCRIEKEELEISRRLGQPWWHMRLALLVQVVFAGIVAGALIGGFLLDHFLKVSDLIQKQQAALEKENDLLVQKNKETESRLEKESKDLKNDKNHLEKQINSLKVANQGLKKNQKKVNQLEIKFNEQIDKFQKIVASLKKDKKVPNDKLKQLVLELEGVKSKGEKSENMKQPLAKKLKLPLRTTPKTISYNEIREMAKKNGFSLPDDKIFGDFRHNYEVKKTDSGEVVIDHATGLMWQVSGSEEAIIYTEALKYVHKLDENKFAGFSGWRLPTIEELLSLLEPVQKSGILFIDPKFGGNQRWIWSVDKYKPNNAWGLVLYEAKLYIPTLNFPYFVRAVRSLEKSD